LRQPLGRPGDPPHGADVDEGRQVRMRPSPRGERRLEPSRPFFSQLDRAAARIGLVSGHFDQPVALQHRTKR
jgi:hypothetical protein